MNLLYLIPTIFIGFLLVWIVNLRRVVPTNMVHIVQSTKTTTAYGRGKDAGNTYYQWPTWIPIIGVSVTRFPESIFQVNLQNYEAYDSARLPFVVDVSAFFRVDDAGVVAQRVESFDELEAQLVNVLQGSVRRILATNALEEIMQERSSLGNQFTDEVTKQIEEWGVTPVKTIEFMDLRDTANSVVIKNIMAKEQSRIDRESRVAVAANKQEAELKEIDAIRVVAVQKQDAEQQIGLRTAIKDREVGIAREKTTQEIQVEAKISTERAMAVREVEALRSADIQKNVSITNAEAAKRTAVLQAEAEKDAALLRSDAMKAEGEAKAKAEELILMAPVTAQITLAQEIGENTNYQQYLLNVEQIKANQVVGVTMADAIAKADLKIISTGSNSNAISDVAGLTSFFNPSGGLKLGGMLEGFLQTDAGKAVASSIVDHVKK